ncbi:MAG: hypothetical protein EA351_01315 [Gemmatimonadales bacterium]|nr:MAG: hypothetical protein EA351_01315 [Gemmatimonadales bacterium]
MSSTHGAPIQPASSAVSLGPTSRVFAFLWASAHILHAWHKGGADLGAPLTDPFLLSILIAGAAVLLRPSSPHRLAILASTQLVVFGAQLPFVANHWTIAAFVNLGIVISYGLLRARGPSAVSDLVAHISPYARAVLVIAYAAASVAKLNTSFLDPIHSCAIALLEPIGLWLGFEPPASNPARYGIIGITTLVELAIPALLVFGRTRLLGITLAATFHLALASTPVVLVIDFTFVIISLLVLFAPADVGNRLDEELRGFSLRRPGFARTLGSLWPVGKFVVVAGVLTVAIGRGMLWGEDLWVTLTWGVFLVFGVVVVFTGLGILASYLKDPPREASIGTARGFSRGHAPLICLLLINAASPYLGLKTTSSFTMFSNLRTEAGSTNHLFLPSLDLFGYQSQVVEVHESSNPFLSQLADSGDRLAYHELRRVLRSDPSASIDFSLNDEVRSVDEARQVPELVELPVLPRKLLHFRSVTSGEHPACQP